MIIILVIGISLFIAFLIRKPRLWFGPTITFKVPTAVQVHILPDNNTTNLGFNESPTLYNVKNVF